MLFRSIIDLKLCSVLFEDNAYYPWIFLVPRVENAKNMTKLSLEERLQLMREMDLCEEVMVENFPCDQTNIAMIGNKTPQLHVHILCRKEGAMAALPTNQGRASDQSGQGF